MICNYCGNNNPDTLAYCKFCGKPLSASRPAVPNYPVQNHIPPEYKPLSPWAYFGYQLLFAIPLVGFVLLIVFSCGGTSNINLKNFARSYWVVYLFVLVLTVLMALIGVSFFEALL